MKDRIDPAIAPELSTVNVNTEPDLKVDDLIEDKGKVESKVSKLTIRNPILKNSKLAFAISQALLVVQISLFINPTLGIYLNAIVFALLVRIAITHDLVRKLAISLAILPVANMISLSLPQTTLFARAVIFYDAILMLGLVYRYMFTLNDPVKSTQITRRGYLTVLPAMIVLGQLFGGLGYLMLRHQYTFGHTSLPLVAATSVIFAISEEVVFRGLIQRSASRVFHPIMAAGFTTVLYTAFSFGHRGSYLAPVFALLMGASLSIIYYKKQNLVLTMCVNAVSKLVYIALMATFVFH